MSVLDVLLGRPLSSREELGQRIAVAAGIAIFGLDALSSAAYGPEAALTVLRPIGELGSQYILPLSLAILALLTIVYFSYGQTIEAYPAGGGSFTVTRESASRGRKRESVRNVPNSAVGPLWRDGELFCRPRRHNPDGVHIARIP
jgi:hypothetical protein